MRRYPVLFGLALCGLAFATSCRRWASDSTAPVVPSKPEATEVAGIVAEPLPVRTPDSEGTRFERLSVERSGIDFGHNWTPPPDYRFEIYNALPGGGVCVGDYDGDGWPDVYLTQPYVGSRLYRNLGDCRFQDVTESAGLHEDSSGQGATFVDIDNDGDLDLYVCNDEQPNRLYLNQGNGTFVDRAPAMGLDFHGASVMMAFADYDRDGDLDGYLVTNRLEPAQRRQPTIRREGEQLVVSPEDREYVDVIVPADGQPRVIKAGQFDHLYRNNGDGSFSDVTSQAGMQGNYWGLSASWWDYDQDGWPDLYVSNDFYGPDQLFRNQRDGTFAEVAAQVFPHTPWYSMGTDVADINNDGWLDLMGSDMSATDHYKQKVSMGDMSKNGWFLTHATPRQYMRNALYLNSGMNRFMEIAYLAGVADTDWTWSLKFADLDEDGYVDLYVTNGMNRDWVNSDLRNISEQATTPEAKMQVWIAAQQRRDTNLAFRNRGDLQFENVGKAWGLDAEIVSYGAALADLDRDGDLDLVVNNSQHAASVYRNRTHDSHRIIIQLRGTASNRMGVGTRIEAQAGETRQVRYLNLSQGYMASNEPCLHLGLGEHAVVERLTVLWPCGQRQEFEHLAADHRYVIQEPPRSDVETSLLPDPAPRLLRRRHDLDQVASREEWFDDFARQPLLPHQLSQLGPGMAWADVDGDGDDDLFLGGSAGQPAQLFRNGGSAGLEPQGRDPWWDDRECEDMGAVFFDADADDDLDLYVVSGGVECQPGDDLLTDRLYYNDGQGNFHKAPAEVLPALAESGSAVVAGDLDRDGDLDLFVGGRVVPGAYPLPASSRVLRNDRERFVDVTDELALGLREAGMVTGALWTDVNSDDWPDLLVAYEWGPVRLFINRRGRLADATHEAGLAERTGWYNGLAAGDVDGDGDLDVVATNFGLNTKYHASPERPALLYYGDFDGSGQAQIVEAEYEGETLFPVRGRSCSSNAMPFLRDKFPRYHDFAIASLGDIYSEGCLENARRFAASSLESGVLLNDGQGHFSFSPLPRLAQISPSFGVVLTELNGDGFVDLVLAQNFFGPQRETGRMDGGLGLVLLGNGDGTFEPLWPERSGLVVAEDATSLTTADLNGDGLPELIVGVNSGTPHTYQLEEAALAANLLTVRLRGPVANRTGVGARVTWQPAHGPPQLAEVSAGSGYLSQSAPTMVFGRSASTQSGQLTVHWPDGTTQTVDVSPEARQLLIEQSE